MSRGTEELSSRRDLLSAVGGAAGLAAFGALGAGGARAREPSITFYLYPGGDAVREYVEEAAAAYRSGFAPQLSALGAELSVQVADAVPEYIDRLRGRRYGSFEAYVDTYTGNVEDGTALHLWFNAAATGGPQTPGGSLVDGDGDAFSDMSMTPYRDRGPTFRRNMYFHEALHAFVEEGRDDYACGSHDANDDEHTCGAVDVRRERFGETTLEYLRVTPLATSYDDDPAELGAACSGVPASYPRGRRYVGEFASCTAESVRRFLARTHR